MRVNSLFIATKRFYILPDYKKRTLEMASGASASTCLLTENKKKKTIWPDKFIYFLYTLIKCKGTKWNICTLSYMKL